MYRSAAVDRQTERQLIFSLDSPSDVRGGYHLDGQLVKTSASKAADLGSCPVFSVGNFPGRVIQVTPKLALQWLPCQAPSFIGSALGLGGPVSVSVSVSVSV